MRMMSRLLIVHVDTENGHTKGGAPGPDIVFMQITLLSEKTTGVLTRVVFGMHTTTQITVDVGRTQG